MLVKMKVATFSRLAAQKVCDVRRHRKLLFFSIRINNIAVTPSILLYIYMGRGVYRGKNHVLIN